MITLSFFLVFAIAVTNAIAEPSFDSKDIFISGLDGYDTCRIPALAVAPDGTILAFAEGRKAGRGDAGDIDLLLKRSLDGGDLWQPMQLVWDDGANTCGNPCPVVDSETGTIWLFSTHNLDEDRERMIWDGTSKGSRTVHVMKSADNGATWSEPLDITDAVKKDNWTWYATGPGSGIRMTNGRLVIPCDHGVAVSKDYQSHVIYSDDHGKSWRLGGSVPDTATSECQVAERSDGSLLINIRKYPERPGLRAISESGDRGKTWSQTRLDPALVASGCQGSFISVIDSLVPRGRIHLFSNPADSKDRINMTVRVSYDDASTWPLAKTIHEGPSAYSSLASLPDGRILCFYERGDRHAYEKLTIARFNREWIENK